MVSEGDDAPTFSAPLADGSIGEFVLADRLDEAPLVLAFFPGAFTEVCSHEMSTFQDRLEAFEAAGGAVYGISVDTPFALNEFRDQLGLGFGLISDTNREIVDAYGVAMDFAGLGVRNVAKRAVFVIDASGTVTYAWISDDPGVEPDYDELEDAVAAAQ
jgi:peroxiredoxin